MKTTTCNKCGKTGLIWATSKAGKFYLTDRDATQIKGENGRIIKTLQLAHKCLTADQQEINANGEQAATRAREITAQLNTIEVEMDTRRDSDEFYELRKQGKTDATYEAMRATRDELRTELQALQVKYNDGFKFI